jgi:hypothetical protein
MVARAISPPPLLVPLPLPLWVPFADWSEDVLLDPFAPVVLPLEPDPLPTLPLVPAPEVLLPVWSLAEPAEPDPLALPLELLPDPLLPAWPLEEPLVPVWSLAEPVLPVLPV